MSDQRLRRQTPAPPVRMVHLGLGNFFRAHQAWYTHRANQDLPHEEQWGIVAFSGRSRTVVDLMAQQDGLYTLLVDGEDGSRTEVVESVVEVRVGTDLEAWHEHLAARDVAVLTLTVTEAGYCVDADGRLDLSDDRVRADLDAWAPGRTDEFTTMPVRVASGLAARREADAGGLSVIPCDNLPGNGAVARAAVLGAAREHDAELADWIEREVSFVSTAVDRITPRTGDGDVRRAAVLSGTSDEAVVVTEPFSEWDLAGDFVAGRPGWERAGASFVDDVRPYEERKLRLLNGAHSVLAYAGSIRGHDTVAEAVADPEVAAWVDQWWEAAIPTLTLPEDELRSYVDALRDRFGNTAIRHRLAQIAADGTQKVSVRFVPVLHALAGEARAAGELSPAVDGALRPVAAWVLHARGAGAPLDDAKLDTVRVLVAGDLREAMGRTLRHWGIETAWLDRALELAREVSRAHTDG